MNRAGTGVLVLGVVVGVVGAIMYWAVRAHAPGFNVHVAGLILFIVGIITAIVGLIVTLMAGRSTTIHREDVMRTPSGEQRYDEEQRRAL